MEQDVLLGSSKGPVQMIDASVLDISVVTHTDADEDEPDVVPCCSRVEAQELLSRSIQSVREPVIITNALDDTQEWNSWQKDNFLEKYGHEAMNCRYTGGFSCKTEDGSSQIVGTEPMSIEAMLSVQRPGNLFLEAKLPVVQEVCASARQKASKSQAFASLLRWFHKPWREKLSLGTKGQMNPVHKHQSTLFVQLQGRKGWLLIAHDAMNMSMMHPQNPNFPNYNDADAMERENFSQRGICRQFESGRLASTRDRCLCEVGPGEILFVPGHDLQQRDTWWHGTCNLDAWTAGFALIHDLDWPRHWSGI